MTSADPAAAEPPHSSQLVRGLGVWSATAIVVGDTIGTGVFLVTSDMARAIALVFAAWILGGVIVLDATRLPTGCHRPDRESVVRPAGALDAWSAGDSGGNSLFYFKRSSSREKDLK
jgi:hypothetical protein